MMVVISGKAMQSDKEPEPPRAIRAAAALKGRRSSDEFLFSAAQSAQPFDNSQFAVRNGRKWGAVLGLRRFQSARFSARSQHVCRYLETPDATGPGRVSCCGRIGSSPERVFLHGPGSALRKPANAAAKP
jgi:hypothetical protein